MEETLQQEKQELEYKNPNEEQGGIRRRLRDRDLLKKRKAEAEEKETNQWVFGVESQRKRPRADAGTKRRGRPKKTERTAETSVVQEEATAPQEAPVVVAVPEPAEVIPDQPSGSPPPLLAVEPSSVPAAPAPQPMFGSNQIPVFGPPLTSPTQVNLTPALFPPSAVVPSPAKFLDTAPIPVSDSSPAPDAVPFPVPVPTQALVPAAAAAPPTAPPQVETLSTESQGREALDQILIEELGPDKEADTSLCQDKVPDEDLIATPSINITEQNEIFSLPTLSSTSPHKYFPGSTF